MSTFEIEMAEINNEAAELLRNEEIKNSWKLRRQEKTKKKKVRLGYVAISRCIAILAIILLAGSITIWKTVFSRHHPPAPSNYTVALHQALMFFDAQRSGKLPEKNIVSWRGDSGLDDGQSKSSSIFKNLSGGYYYAGDAIKFNFPTSFAMTMLSWSVVEYSAKYEAAGELIHIKDIIKWGTDYFLKTFDSTAHSIDRIVQQVGNGDISGGRSANDRYCWMRPEDIDYDRPVIECQRCPDLAAEMATALASASIVFKDYKKYSGKLMRGAKTLFKFSQDQLNNNGSDIEATLSTNYWDEFIWGAAWLYYATGNISYLHLATSQEFAERAGAFRGGPLNGVLSWDNKLPGAQVLLTRLRLFRDPGYPYDDIMRTFDNQTRVFMCSYLSFFTHFKRTNGGLLELNHGAPQPLQYVVNAVFLARLYIDYLKAAGIAGWYCGPYFFYVTDLRKFAFVQMNYILGINPRNLSYVMGYGNDYPKQVHHRGASIPNDGKRYSCEGGWIWQDSPNPNPNTIIGAMVAGPDKNHGFDDLRSNYNFTEPTLAGNADLVAALVALSYEESMGIDNDLINYALPSGWFQSPPPPWQP